jgi:hypothetical protein
VKTPEFEKKMRNCGEKKGKNHQTKNSSAGSFVDGLRILESKNKGGNQK